MHHLWIAKCHTPLAASIAFPHWGPSIFPLSLSYISVWQDTGGLTPEGSQCSLVVSGAFDGRLRLWDIDPTAVVGGRANMLGTLSNKVRRCERETSMKQNETDSQDKGVIQFTFAYFRHFEERTRECD